MLLLLRLLAAALLGRLLRRALCLLEDPRALLLLGLGVLLRPGRLVKRGGSAAAKPTPATAKAPPRLLRRRSRLLLAQLRLKLSLLLLLLVLPRRLRLLRLQLRLKLRLLRRRRPAAAPPTGSRACGRLLLQLPHLRRELLLQALRLLELRLSHLPSLRLQLRIKPLLQLLQLRHLRRHAAPAAPATTARTTAVAHRELRLLLLRLLVARDLPRVVNKVVLAVAVQILCGGERCAQNRRKRLMSSARRRWLAARQPTATASPRDGMAAPAPPSPRKRTAGWRGSTEAARAAAHLVDDVHFAVSVPVLVDKVKDAVPIHVLRPGARARAKEARRSGGSRAEAGRGARCE